MNFNKTSDKSTSYNILMHSKLFIFILSCIFWNNSNAQSLEHKRDSIINLIDNVSDDSTKAWEYYRLARLYRYTKPLEAIKYGRNMLRLEKKIGSNKGISKAYEGLFYSYYYLGPPADTLLVYLKLLEEHTKKNFKEEEKMWISYYWISGIYYSNLNQLDKEIDSYIKALEILKKHNGSLDRQSKLLNNIGAVLYYHKKYSEALRYYHEGLKIVKDNASKASMLFNCANIYELDNKEDSARIYYDEAYIFYKKANSLDGIISTLLVQASYHDKDKEFERAYQLYSEALELIEMSGLKSKLSTAYLSIAEHYKLRKQYYKAIEFGEKGVAETKNQKNYRELLEIYSVLHESYAATGNYQKAYKVRGEQIMFTDSVRSTELTNKVEELETKFDVEQKEYENKLLKAQAKANQKTIQSRNTTAIALSLGLLLLASWFLLILRSNRQKQKHNQELEAKVEERTTELQVANQNLEQANYELRTFNYIASHDIKEPIRNIGNYAGLIFRKLPNDIKPSFQFYFDTIKNSASQLYTLVEDFFEIYSIIEKG